MRPIERLALRSIVLPEPLRPKGSYVPVRIFQGTAWVSGCTGRSREHGPLAGVVGATLDVEAARQEAERAAINLLAALEHGVGLDAVAAVVQVRGFVRAADDFADHPAVLDAASNLLLDTFGPEIGTHARTVVGVSSLPGNASVELDAVIALR
ncbi:RidA family protein [Nakamurella lactea]|uniref:RidA family protein n=1 Tax=Nakamurella lactea TaxID=459515 RepID=UPI000417D72E|nr:RidA family protein [Nakamurella lactea]